ncbi:MAG TPA: rhomboid family intramembrane serine protease, partial [Planctomycetota bacterium]|nr:rhomboid family intramembrane serine protease [Planctomycetota bacterium]
MGIYDRDYTRTDRGGGAITAFSGHPALTALVAVNLAVFILWQVAPAFAGQHFVVSLDAVGRRHAVYTLLTYAVSQYAPMHLAFNMLALWWFGRELEESVYGTRSFVFLYVFGALVSAGAHLAMNAARGYDVPALGAS